MKQEAVMFTNITWQSYPVCCFGMGIENIALGSQLKIKHGCEEICDRGGAWNASNTDG